MKGDRYVKGAIALAHSIKKSGSTHDTVCMVTDDVSDKGIVALKKVFDTVITVDYIVHNSPLMRTKKIENIYGSWKNYSYTKWNSLNLVQYDKIIMMDSDLVVLKNMDELFKLKAPAATFSLYCTSEYSSKKNINFMVNPYKGVKHGGRVMKHQIEKGYNSFICISTSMVLKPSRNYFNLYKNMLKQMEPFYVGNCINGVDECSITYFFDKILCLDWHHVHQAFNAIPWKPNWLPKKGKFIRPYVSHYTGIKKPWEMKKGEWNDIKIWWNCYEDALKTYGIIL
jgi:lipopolysaccharide biosynthesis glycosyltransferase